MYVYNCIPGYTPGTYGNRNFKITESVGGDGDGDFDGRVIAGKRIYFSKGKVHFR